MRQKVSLPVLGKLQTLHSIIKKLVYCHVILTARFGCTYANLSLKNRKLKNSMLDILVPFSRTHFVSSLVFSRDWIFFTNVNER